jgi:hypothetical protein
MKNKVYTRAFLPILIVFLFTSLFILIGSPVLRDWNTDSRALLCGDELFFILTTVSYFLHIKSLKNPNPHVFVRMIYGSLIIKMVVCLAAAVVYGLVARPVNKNAIFGCFILYVLYTFMEVRVLTKLLKRSPNNAKERSAA